MWFGKYWCNLWELVLTEELLFNDKKISDIQARLWHCARGPTPLRGPRSGSWLLQFTAYTAQNFISWFSGTGKSLKLLPPDFGFYGLNAPNSIWGARGRGGMWQEGRKDGEGRRGEEVEGKGEWCGACRPAGARGPTLTGLTSLATRSGIYFRTLSCWNENEDNYMWIDMWC